MGIPSLTGFIEDNFTSWQRKDVEYRSPEERKLVIDGLSLCHNLYEDQKREGLSRNDILLGGDYVSFANYIHHFFNTLKEHNINPFVVFDGIDIDLAKNKTHDYRRRKDTETVDQLLRKEIKAEDKLHIKPYLLFDVMIQTVQNILSGSDSSKDRFKVVDGDADVDIVKMCRKYGCPVLGDDSDFYVFPLPDGYIPYKRFNWHNAKKDGKIRVDIYYRKHFLEQFTITESSLALLPAIAGNDTIDPVRSYKDKRLPQKKNLIWWAIRYAASFNTYTDACITARQFSQTLYDNLQKAYKEYFSQIHNPVTEQSKLYIKLHEKFSSQNDAERVYHSIQTGEFPKLLVDALFFPVVSLRVSFEDLSQNWCHSIGAPIRGLVYTILHGGSTIEENQRQKGKCIYSAKPITAPSLQITLPQLQKNDFTQDNGRMILYSVLESKEAQFTQINPKHQLLLAVTRYWYIMSEINPHKKEIFLQTFLMFLLAEEKNSVAQLALATECSQEEFQIHVTHAIAEWQSLYYCVHCLNQLLKKPLHLLEPSNFLQCSILHSYTEAVRKDGIDKVLKDCGFDNFKYKIYLDVIITTNACANAV